MRTTAACSVAYTPLGGGAGALSCDRGASAHSHSSVLAVRARRIGTRPDVAQCQALTGGGKGARDVGGAIVRHDPLHADSTLREPVDRAGQEPDGIDLGGLANTST